MCVWARCVGGVGLGVCVCDVWGGARRLCVGACMWCVGRGRESQPGKGQHSVCVCGGGDRVGMSVCMPCEGGVCVWVCV